jgi:hypothetical protein
MPVRVRRRAASHACAYTSVTLCAVDPYLSLKMQLRVGRLPAALLLLLTFALHFATALFRVTPELYIRSPVYQGVYVGATFVVSAALFVLFYGLGFRGVSTRSLAVAALLVLSAGCVC